MSINFKKATMYLLIAMPASGCASQNAMSFLPDAVKLDVARDKAAKQGPISVTDMMEKAKALQPKKIASKVDPVQTATNKPAQPDANKTAFAEDKKVKAPAIPRADEVAIVANAAGTEVSDEEASYASVSPADLFQQAMLLNHKAVLETQALRPTISADDLKAAAAAEEWQKLIAKQTLKSEEVASAKPIASDKPPLVMPLNRNEIIAVNLEANGAGLSKDDELKLKLLKFGKRFPQQIIVGKIVGQSGFQLMQSALGLGALITQASGGEPAVTYDPAISAGAAELHYLPAGYRS